MARHTYDKIKELVKKHNKSTTLSDEFVICLMWKESSFDDAAKNAKSSATGLMQITKAAVEDVNTKIAPDGVRYEHKDLTDPAKNIECGTYYLDLRIRWAKDKKKGIEGYGTGRGYADNILTCEKCMNEDAKNSSKHWQTCLHKIHK